MNRKESIFLAIIASKISKYKISYQKLSTTQYTTKTYRICLLVYCPIDNQPKFKQFRAAAVLQKRLVKPCFSNGSKS